ncbi:MAG: trimethylamine methyltransferase family protein [Candidatus Bathyarchaeota archaeon]|nr:MAG: trimethylamine methyltransferase family protein [Candidatus Bathyarchaeota archaeon]
MGKMRLQILSRDDIKRIHNASIKVLETIGAQFLNHKALDYLEKYGCTIDRKRMTAKIPEAVVNEFMKKALPEIPYVNRDLKPIPRQEIHFATFDQGTYLTERDGTSHPSTCKDVEKVLIVGNSLDAVDIPNGAVAARDINPETAGLHTTLITWNTLSNPKKALPGYGGRDGKTMKVIIEMASVLAGGIEQLRKTPFITGGVCPTSPLVWPGPGLDSMMIAAENGMATWTIGMATSGSMAPMSLAGTMVVHNAEMLSFETFSQLVAYDAGWNGIAGKMGCSSSVLDVRKGYYPVGNPEMALLNAAAAELAQYYQCPNVSAGA